MMPLVFNLQRWKWDGYIANVPKYTLSNWQEANYWVDGTIVLSVNDCKKKKKNNKIILHPKC